MSILEVEIRAEPGLAGDDTWIAGMSGAGLPCGSLAQHRQLQYEVSRYIELLLGELLTMARAAELGRLLHSLEAAYQDATEQTGSRKPTHNSNR